MIYSANIIKKLRLPLNTDSLCVSYLEASAVVSELIDLGYKPTKELFDALCNQSSGTLTSIYNDLQFLGEIIGDGDYDLLYPSFPDIPDVPLIIHRLNSIYSLFTGGGLLFDREVPDDVAELVEIDYSKLKEISLYEGSAFDVVKPLLAATQPFSELDRKIVTSYLDRKHELNIRDVKFGENRAFISAYIFNTTNELVVSRADDVLKTMYVRSGMGAKLTRDLGGKRFLKYTNHQKTSLLEVLEKISTYYPDSLEESMKLYENSWKRVIQTLNPTSQSRTKDYPNFAKVAANLRNPKIKFQTYAGKVDALLASGSDDLWGLLGRNKGYFVRNLNRIVNARGFDTVYKLLSLDLSLKQLVNLYNYVNTRRTSKTRSTVLASESTSTVSQYGKLEKWDKYVVNGIQETIRESISKKASLGTTYIDPKLYMTPLSTNNRASSLSSTSVVIGETEVIPDNVNYLALFCHWDGYVDIDTSVYIFGDSFAPTKVGWNSDHRKYGVVYSGDNRGSSSKNAESIQIDLDELESNGVNWLIMDSFFYGGSRTFKSYNSNVRTGYQTLEEPIKSFGKHWLPHNLETSRLLKSDTSGVYTFAFNVQDRTIVYLDVNLPNMGRVSGNNSAIEMLDYVKSIYNPTTRGWKKLNQGHIIELLSSKVVDDPTKADTVFSETTTSEEVSALIS